MFVLDNVDKIRSADEIIRLFLCNNMLYLSHNLVLVQKTARNIEILENIYKSLNVWEDSV